MPAIPIYRQRTETSGALTPADARGVEVRSAAGDAGQNLAASIGRAGIDMAEREREMRMRAEQQKEDDATAWMSQSLASFRANRTEDFIARRTTAEAGAPNFTPSVLDDFDIGAKDLIAKAPTPRSKQMMEVRLTELRSSLAQDAMVFEANARADWRMGQASQAIDKAAVAVLLDPTQYEAALGEQYALLGQYELHGEAMSKARELAVGKISAAAVTGMIEKAPRETLRALQSKDGGGYGAVNALDAEQRIRFTNQAQAEVNRREAEYKANQAIARGEFNERVANATAMALTLGTPGPNAPTQAEFIRMYGAEEGGRKYADFQVVEQYGVTMSSLRGLSHEEIYATLEKQKPTEATPNFAEAQKGYNMLEQAARATIKAYTDDPARYVLTYTPAVREAYTAMQATLNDPQATPEQQQIASSNFYTAMTAEQTRIGGKPAGVLPKQYVESVASAFAQEDPQGGSNAAAMVNQLAQQWGPKWGAVSAELGDALPPVARTIASGVAPAPAALLVEASSLKHNELVAGLPPGSESSVTDALSSVIAPLRTVFAPAANGGRQFADLYNSTKLLALTYVRQGMPASEAADKAFNDVVAERYEFADTYMVPRDQAVDEIMSGAAAYLSDIPPESLAVDARDLRGRTPEEYRAEVARSLANQGFWGNAPRDAGLQLYGPNGQPVMRADGEPYVLSWQELQGHQYRIRPRGR